MTQRHLPLANVVTIPSTRPRNRTAYRRGADAERELLRSLQRDGLLAVRSAASAGPYDLLVATDGGGRAIQCKRCASEPTPATIARWLAALPTPPAGWRAELWVKVNGCGWRRFTNE